MIHDLRRFIVDDNGKAPSGNKPQMMTTSITSIPLEPPTATEQALAGERTKEGSGGEAPWRRSKRPGTLRTVKNSLRGDGDLEGGHRRNHSRRTSLAVPTGPRISWKSDPRESFCDWRIEVHHLNKKGEAVAMDIYNIHRNVVGFGPRKSNFMVQEFVRQIEDRNYGSGANITKLELPFWQAEAFPMVLDFLYDTKEVRQTLTAERACSVFQIAETLDIPPLETAIENFYSKTLSIKNMTDFMAAASNAKADRLLFASRAKIGSLIFEKPELAGLLLPQFMIDILRVHREQVQEIQSKTPEGYPEHLKISHSRLWSKAAFVCASHNMKSITKEIFKAMTQEDCLPAVDASVAFKFLMLDVQLNPDNDDYTSFQKRCVQSITDNWEKFSLGYSSPEELSKEIRQLPLPVLEDILTKSTR